MNNSVWAVSTLDAALWVFNTKDNNDSIPDRWVKVVKIWEKVGAFIERFLDALGK